MRCKPAGSLLKRIFLCCLSLAALAGCRPEPVEIPQSFTPYFSKGGTFKCEVPENWQTKGGGKRGPEWAKISSGSALIHIKVGVAGSIINEAVGGNVPGGGNMPQFEPVHLFHVSGIELAKEEYDQYAEMPGSPVVLQCKLGPARISEFTAQSAAGTNQHGYRATIIGLNKSLNVICICDESDWIALKPAFDKLFATLEQGENY